MASVGEHRGHRLVERRSPRGHAVYRVPERYAGASISDVVRALGREGWTRAEINRVTGIRYQHVRNVLAEMVTNDPAAPGRTAPAKRGSDRVEMGEVGSHVAFADLVARAEQGEEIHIERDGSVVARLVPVAPRAHDEAIAAACRRMDELAEQATLGDLSIRELIDDGRRH